MHLEQPNYCLHRPGTVELMCYYLMAACKCRCQNDHYVGNIGI